MLFRDLFRSSSAAASNPGADAASAITAATDAEFTRHQKAGDQLFGFRQMALEGARGMAARDNNRKPTLEDYRQAALQLRDQVHAAGLPWEPNNYADLSGVNSSGMNQDLNGFLISEPGKKIGNLEFYDRDSDGTISDFYTNIRLSGANCKNCIVDPAASYNTELAKAETIDGSTFRNFSDKNEQSFTLGAGARNNITLEAFSGGHVDLSGTQITTLTIIGSAEKSATFSQLTMDGRSSINGMEAAGAHFIRIDTLPPKAGEPGAKITGANLEKAKIDMGSTMPDLQDVNFKNAELTDVNLSGRTLTRVDLTGAGLRNVNFNKAVLNEITINADADLRGVDFSNATLNNVKLIGKDGKERWVVGPEQLHVMGAKVNEEMEINVIVSGLGHSTVPAVKDPMAQLASTVNISSWAPTTLNQTVPAPAAEPFAPPSNPLAAAMDYLNSLSKEPPMLAAAEPSTPYDASKPPEPALTKVSLAPTHIGSLSGVLDNAFRNQGPIAEMGRPAETIKAEQSAGMTRQVRT